MANKKGCPQKKSKQASEKKNLEICPDKEAAIKENKKLAKLRRVKQECQLKATKKAWKNGLKQGEERKKAVKEGKIIEPETYTLSEEDDLEELSTFHIGKDLVLRIYYDHDGRHGRDNWRYELSEGTRILLDETSLKTPSTGNKNIFSRLKKIIMEKYKIIETKAEEYITQLKGELRDIDWTLFYSKKEEKKGIADIYAIKAFEQAEILNTPESIKKGWEYLSRENFIDLLKKELNLGYITSSEDRAIYEFLGILKTVILTIPSGSVLSGESAIGKSHAVKNAQKGIPDLFFARASDLTARAPYYLKDAFGSARAFLIFDSDLDENDMLLKLARQISVDDEGCSILVTVPNENDISTVQRVTLSRDIKALLSTSTRINYEKQFSTRIDRISIESSHDKIYKIGKLKLDGKEKLPWDKKKEKSFRPDNEENWLLRALWISLIFKTNYVCPGISRLADYQPITNARATRDVDKALGDVDGWCMLNMPRLTWICHQNDLVAIVPPDIWLEGIALCNPGLLETYLERDERTKKVIKVVGSLGNTEEKREFAAKDVFRLVSLDKKEVYTILSKLENDGIIIKTEEARGSKPAKYQYLSDNRRKGYFDFSQKVVNTELSNETEDGDFNPIKRADPEEELKLIWEHAWKEYYAVIDKYKNSIVSELSIPIFSLELCDFGVRLNESGERGDDGGNTRNTKDTQNTTDTTPHKTAFAGVCVCVPEPIPRSPRSPRYDKKFNVIKEKFNIIPKDFSNPSTWETLTFTQKKQILKEFIDTNKKAGYPITDDFLFNQKKIPQSFITQCMETDILKKLSNDEYGL